MKLGYSPAEWDDLPWHHQRMFIEGFEAEELLENSPSSQAAPGTPEAPEDFGALDALMKGAKTRRAGRG